MLNSVLIALVPIAVQSAVLYMIFTKHKLLRGIIRIWSALLIIGGVFGLFAAYVSPDPVNIIVVADKAIFLMIGFIYLLLSDKYIQLNEISSNN